MAARRCADREQQADRALDAFGRNGSFGLAGGRQVTDLDDAARQGTYRFPLVRRRRTRNAAGSPSRD